MFARHLDALVIGRGLIPETVDATSHQGLGLRVEAEPVGTVTKERLGEMVWLRSPPFHRLHREGLGEIGGHGCHPHGNASDLGWQCATAEASLMRPQRGRPMWCGATKAVHIERGRAPRIEAGTTPWIEGGGSVPICSWRRLARSKTWPRKLRASRGPTPVNLAKSLVGLLHSSEGRTAASNLVWMSPQRGATEC
eukprot:CAMPEP_0194506404 /NCGR_PEP_ID=MMETSP0253-20130528/34870_1 /TAXON_ID=2966 /ORGANISM="Noctiluca scintillans" /LENGTH=194 /DNA_ID=CAMNT_0039349143 /DNA_START=159 /DNA_END=743 /DNA_ORIENTATION=+